ncbi:fucose isomerase [Silvibacterium acidisoli]|uniref:fucose isomerase n=1 Tax=Acidobacteriaceae bacterium ZG23-2 TaxID=2883246 RepID=UPI00406CCF7E
MAASAESKRMNEVVLITSGDLRQSANEVCWPAQRDLEKRLTECFEKEGVKVRRAFPIDKAKGHGFISSQRMGMDIFEGIDPHANLVFATAAWQYSHHVLPGMRSHLGPIITIANWSGQWPGLVGLLNLNGSLVKASVKFDSLWSKDFDDEYFLSRLREWIETGKVTHDLSHVRALDPGKLPSSAKKTGEDLAAALKKKKAIFGIFDEGCMGMYNAIIDDELLNPLGIFKERLSQSALVARMRTVKDDEARAVREWLDKSGVKFHTGKDPKTELTDEQVLEQCRMYIAALRIAHDFRCDAIGIQYQQGLKDMVPASDLVEGLLNNTERPPAHSEEGEELYPGGPLPHFNEVDECAGVDALVTNRCWKALGLDPATTLHDVRWGEDFSGNGVDGFVWVLQISGAAPASHFAGGYKGSSSDRQPPMYFPLGGGTLKGIGRAGRIVWSRVFVEAGRLHVDMGLGSVVDLPAEETKRRWEHTTTQWPMVSAVFDGISRDMLMARHRANHVNIAYVPDDDAATNALATKAAMFHALGVDVHLCGDVSL